MKTIILVGLILTGVNFANEQSSDEPTRNLQPPKQMQVCRTNADCIEVNISCNDCCDKAAINKRFKKEFEKSLSECRQKWRGGFCNCVSQVCSVECRKSQCERVNCKWKQDLKDRTFKAPIGSIFFELNKGKVGETSQKTPLVGFVIKKSLAVSVFFSELSP